MGATRFRRSLWDKVCHRKIAIQAMRFQASGFRDQGFKRASDSSTNSHNPDSSTCASSTNVRKRLSLGCRVRLLSGAGFGCGVSHFAIQFCRLCKENRVFRTLGFQALGFGFGFRLWCVVLRYLSSGPGLFSSQITKNWQLLEASGFRYNGAALGSLRNESEGIVSPSLQ